MDDLAARLSGRKLDWKQRYRQIPMLAADINKTAMINPFGLFKYIWMPFGLHNSGLTFQCMTDRVIACMEGVICYPDQFWFMFVFVFVFVFMFMFMLAHAHAHGRGHGQDMDMSMGMGI
jgi:hypothetical protein